MSTAVLGSGTFLDLFDPLKGKSEWGMDTLTRKGHIARSLAAAFIATLAQGQVYPPGSSNPYYLQTWDIDDNPNVATITLNYKGFVTGGTPKPLKERDFATVIGRTTADYSTEGTPAGVGRFYRQDVLWTLASPATVPGDYGISGKFLRDRYAVSAAMEFIYRSPQTTYRYFTVGETTSAKHHTIGFSYTIIIEKARILLSDGTTYEGRDQETYFDLTPTPIQKVVSFQAREVVGSPWWECTDVVRLELE